VDRRGLLIAVVAAVAAPIVDDYQPSLGNAPFLAFDEV
jgi:hypothetical protein